MTETTRTARFSPAPAGIGAWFTGQRWPRIDARWMGAALAMAGLGLLCVPALVAGALGLQLLALAFWTWARAAEDRVQQIPRWAWLQRPAAALWLAAASVSVLEGASRSAIASGTVAAFAWVPAVAVLWAGLELLAALPLARPYSDRPGPLLAVGPWLPVLLPAAGFVVLWRHAPHWVSVEPVRSAALVLLMLTAGLATLRAFSRGRWVASLRWQVVSDSAMAALLVALRAVHGDVSLLLWTASVGGRTALLAGELRGSAPRRRPTLQAMWRLATWTASAALAWPVLVSVGFGGHSTRRTALAIALAAVVALSSWVTVRRLVEAPERRAMVRRESAISLSQVIAILALALGPVALLLAWWQGFEASWPGSALAMLPALLGGGAAWVLEHRALAAVEPGVAARGPAMRRAAEVVFRWVVAIEQHAVRLVSRVLRGVIAPSRDLHTGDAQEYLLFLAGLSVLALTLALLQ